MKYWRLLEPGNFAVRQIADDFLVYCYLSGCTHRLGDQVRKVFDVVANAVAPIRTEEILYRIRNSGGGELAPDTIEELLNALAALNLIESA